MSSAPSSGNKSTTVWLFATIEVSSRLWAGSVLGRRSDHNARAVISEAVRRGRVVGCPLIATDGFEYYAGAVGDLFGVACVFGQVLKDAAEQSCRPGRAPREDRHGGSPEGRDRGVGGFSDLDFNFQLSFAHTPGVCSFADVSCPSRTTSTSGAEASD